MKVRGSLMPEIGQGPNMAGTWPGIGLKLERGGDDRGLKRKLVMIAREEKRAQKLPGEEMRVTASTSLSET